MSDILIKGMEMPKSCWACACYHHKVDGGYYDYDVCQASGTVFNDGYSSATGNKTHIDPFKQRLDNCPLVPVPPHGDLIDADKLVELCDIMADKCDGIGASIWHQFKTTVEWSPIVIPAEEGE